ncbi:MAG: acyl-CoA synthetase [Pseudomonadota bacterium]
MNVPFANVKDVQKMVEDMPYAKRMPHKTVYQQLSATAEQFPNNPAISYQITSGPSDKNITLSWSELKEQVTRAANYFRSIGIGEKDVIAYLLPSTHETLITLMGGMVAGIVAPINPTLEPEKISALLTQLDAKAVVTLRPFPKTDVAQLTADALKDAPSVKTLIEIDLVPHLSGLKSFIAPLIRPKLKEEHNVPKVDFNAALATQPGDALTFKENMKDRFCAYFHTGGTTGLPKFAQHRFSGVLYQGWLGSTLLMDETDCMICPMPLFHVFAAYPAWASCMASGTHMVMPTPAGYRGDGVFENFWKLIERYKATFVITVPTAAARLMQIPVDADISSLKNAFCGSAPLPVELFKRFQEVTGVEIVEGYGMTEATCLISCNPVDGERKIGSVGIALPYTDVKIMQYADSSGKGAKEVKTGEVGEICVANPGVVTGNTYTDPDKNKELFVKKSFMRTGDLGRVDKDGYLWITGRAKDVIIRGGHNIDPATIEEALAEHEQVAFAGAIGQPDAHAGELPCAYVELVEGADVDADALIAFANERIGDPTARPKYLEVLDELPKTAVGKVFKPALRESAITRVYNAALEGAGLPCSVTKVIEDKKRGQVACLTKTGDVTDAQVKSALGSFIRPWQWQ